MSRRNGLFLLGTSICADVYFGDLASTMTLGRVVTNCANLILTDVEVNTSEQLLASCCEYR